MPIYDSLQQGKVDDFCCDEFKNKLIRKSTKAVRIFFLKIGDIF